MVKKNRLFRHIIIILLPFIFLGIIILTSHLLWRAKNEKILEIAIVDKTVPFDNYREHMGLFWTLHFDRYIHSDGNYYDPAYEYIGYYPYDRPNPELLTSADIENKDILYMTDTYGVYTLDLVSPDKSSALDRSELIFGGVEKIELQAIENFINTGKTLITEFNFFADPTSPSVREQLEKILHLQWKHWVGRFFEDLSDHNAIPHWAPRLYRAQYDREYDFTGPGIILVSDAEKIIVLERKIDFIDYPRIRTYPNKSELISKKEIITPFYYWFDIVTANPESNVLGDFFFDWTDNGKQKLADFDIPLSFPAIIEYKGDYTAYYFAGDFVDTPIKTVNLAWFTGTPILFSLWSNIDTSFSQHYFFWHLYLPMMRHILHNAYIESIQ